MGALVRRSVLSISTLLGGGCSIVYGDELDTKQCKIDADCEAAAMRLETPLVCRQNACQAPTCHDSAECPRDAICTDGLCIADPGAGSADAGPQPVVCTQDSECNGEQEERCGLDGFCYVKWGCLDDDPDWPSAPSSLDLQIQLQDINGPDPSLVGPVLVSACGAADPTCSRPIVVNNDVTISTDKLVTVPFSGLTSSGFRGAIRVESAVPGSGILPGYLHFTAENPVVAPFKAPRPLQLVPMSRLQNLALFTGITAAADAAGMFLYVFDCGGRPASEVSMTFSNAPGAQIIPLQGERELVLGSNKTTADGTLIVVNLPPNLVQVLTLRDEATGRVISDTFNLIPRGPAVNFVTYYPRQSTVAHWTAQADE
jgi:hypothetical protein